MPTATRPMIERTRTESWEAGAGAKQLHLALFWFLNKDVIGDGVPGIVDASEEQ